MTTKEEFVASRGGRGGGGRGGREGAVQGVAVGGDRTAGGRGRGRGLEIMAVNHDRWLYRHHNHNQHNNKIINNDNNSNK